MSSYQLNQKETDDNDMGSGHATASSSQINPDPTAVHDMEISNVIYEVTADEELVKRMRERSTEGEVKLKKSRCWDDEVKKMNEALTEEGFEHSIIEMYSPKRVNGMAELMGIIPGMSLDLMTNDVDGLPWDFNISEKRERAERLVREKKALLLIGSPMCSAFSQLQIINFSRMSPDDAKRVIAYGTTHLVLYEAVSNTA